MADLVGSIHQFLNNCKDTIVSWCKDAAKTVCLPLTGGTVNGNVVITGAVSSNGEVSSNGVSTTSNANIISPARFINFINNSISKKDSLFASTTTAVYAFDKDGNKATNRLGALGFLTGTNSTRTQLTVHSLDYDSSNSNTKGVYVDEICVAWDTTNGFFTYAPHPKKIVDGSAVLNTADNSNRIATTYWVNQMLDSVRTDATKWVKSEVTSANATTDKPQGVVNQTCVRLKEGIQICWGLVSNAKPNFLVTFSKPFISATYSVTATLHYGGSGSGSGLIASRAHEDSSIHVYDTTAASFRLGRDMYITDYNNYINNGTNIGLGWTEWIAIGWWK